MRSAAGSLARREETRARRGYGATVVREAPHGLLASTVLTLLIIPSVYNLLDRRR